MGQREITDALVVLVAINRLTGRRVLADDVERKHPCDCPECGENLIHKLGRVVIHHFAHYARTSCSLSQGETIRHLQMKRQMLDRFALLNVRAEAEIPWINGRRADIALPDFQIAVECQCAPMTIEEWESRTRDYNYAGIAVMWVWEISRVYGKLTARFPENYIEPDSPFVEQHEPEYRVPAEIRFCAAMHDDRVFALDRAGELRFCDIFSAAERYKEWYDESGEWHEAEYTPSSLKRISSYPCFTLEDYPHASSQYQRSPSDAPTLGL